MSQDTITPFHEATIATWSRDVARAEVVAFAVHDEARRQFPDGTRQARRDISKLLLLLDRIDHVAERLERIAELEETGQ